MPLPQQQQLAGLTHRPKGAVNDKDPPPDSECQRAPIHQVHDNPSFPAGRVNEKEKEPPQTAQRQQCLTADRPLQCWLPPACTERQRPACGTLTTHVKHHAPQHNSSLPYVTDKLNCLRPFRQVPFPIAAGEYLCGSLFSRRVYTHTLTPGIHAHATPNPGTRCAGASA